MSEIMPFFAFSLYNAQLDDSQISTRFSAHQNKRKILRLIEIPLIILV